MIVNEKKAFADLPSVIESQFDIVSHSWADWISGYLLGFDRKYSDDQLLRLTTQGLLGARGLLERDDSGPARCFVEEVILLVGREQISAPLLQKALWGLVEALTPIFRRETTLSEEEKFKASSDLTLLYGRYCLITSNVIAEMSRTNIERLALALQNADMGVWDWNLITGEVVTNEYVDYLFGFSPEGAESPLNGWEEFVHQNDLGLCKNAAYSIIEGERETIQLQWRARTKSGYWSWVEGLGRVVEKDSDGKPIRLVGTLRNIDSEKRAKVALELTEKVRNISISAMTEKNFVENVCHLLVTSENYRMAWVGYAEHGKEKRVRPIGGGGFEEGYLESVKITWDESPEGRGPTGTGIRTGKPSICRDICNDPNFKPWREEAQKRGYASAASFPLMAGGGPIGAVNVYSATPDAFGQEEVEQLSLFAQEVLYALQSFRAKEDSRSAKEAYKKSEERFGSLMTSLPVIFFACDANGIITMVDGAGLSSIDLKPERVVGESISTFANNSPAMMMGVGYALADENVIDIILLNNRWFKMVLSPTKDEKGGVTGVSGFLVDISERKKAEINLSESEARFRAIFEESPLSIMLIDPDTGIIFDANGATSSLLEMERDKIIGMSFLELCPPEERTQRLKMFLSTPSQGSGGCIEGTLVRSDGVQIPVEVSRQSLTVKGRKIKMGIIRDLSDQKMAADTRKMLIQAQKQDALGHLSSGIAHDFNNVLHCMIGFTEILKMRFAKEGVTDHNETLDRIIKAGRRGNDLSKRLLAFGRETDGEKVPCDLVEVTQDAIKMLRPVIPSTISIKQEYMASKAIVKADAGQLNQVITNLVINAVHAMPEGGRLNVLISSCACQEDETFHQGEECFEKGYCASENNSFCLEISDTGQGMDEKTVEKIFVPFFTTKESGEGAGLGLSVASGIVSEHDGEINVTSKVGCGSTFQICLPVSEQKSGKEDCVDVKGISLAFGKLLFVDDDELIVEMAKSSLENEGFLVTAFSSSKQAFEAFFRASESYDAIITDLTMPEMSGVELIRNVRKLRSDIPIFLCTGDDNEDISLEDNLGPVTLMQKPFSPKEMLEKLVSI